MKHQLVTSDGELPEDALAVYLDSLGANAWHTGYQVVAIMGPQSSGKSTLMNHVFGTNFDEMNHEMGRSQTTKGVWMAKASKPEGFPTLVMDLEGTDGRERGEDDTAFEKQTALFAMAAADVLLVNMWCNDIGREVASGKPLLKTIFQVNLKVFNPRKTVLLFVIRDKSRTPLEMLQANLREDLDRIWTTITKPERHADAAFDDFFDLRFVALAHFEHAHDNFLSEAAELCERFATEPGVEGSLRPPVGKAVPTSGLVVSLREVWKAVKDNRDLDLPAHKVMVATVRCEEIANARLANLASTPELAHLTAATAAAAAPPGLASKFAKLTATELAAYDEEAQYFDGGVRASKRLELRAKLITALRPVASAHLTHSAAKLMQRLRDAMAAAGVAASKGKAKDAGSSSSPSSVIGFAAACSGALADVREQWAAALADAVPKDPEDEEGDWGGDGGGGGLFSPYKSPKAFDAAKAAGDAAKAAVAGMVTWSSVAADATAAFEKEATAAVSAERKERLAEATHTAERAMERGVGAAVMGLLEDAPADLWDRLNALLASSAKKHCAQLSLALAGFELAETETVKHGAAMSRRVREVVESKARDSAVGALAAMKTAFARVFSKDSKGLPRTWKVSDDVAAINRRAQREALRVLGLLTVMRLKGKEGGSGGGGGGAEEEDDDEWTEAAAASQEAIDAALATFVPEPPPTAAEGGAESEAGAEGVEGAANTTNTTATPAKPSAPKTPAKTPFKAAAGGPIVVEFPTEWEGESDAAVMISPAECRSVWRQFEADTAYAVSQALAAREAVSRGGQPSAPLWMIGALVVTGFDEVMWLLRNPITLLFLIALGLFLRALYKNLDVETALAMGVVPGLMFLATKVLPTAILILKRLADEGAGAAAMGAGAGLVGAATPKKAAMPAAAAADPVTPVTVKKAGAAEGDKMFTTPSSEGVKQRRPAAMMYPGGGSSD
eukprot:CAMPEP_0197578866 /NCGR_PEP_ID=MMETSP1326-20131121/2974_1 /TAXON_ID=1155430 /ORGANISM="Genus nov. species nov., Strain RCC2288" /LENGTH=959 /DNA_ID=CAMNT_0043142149 /DNA_START=252 /DNA_END=3131 /DNA_ORIENTATION=+